jgi:predicted branched-subunit amino acid permease
MPPETPSATIDKAPSARTPFTRAGVRRGFIDAQPLAVGTLVYALAFGVLALGSGLTLVQSVLMSASVYSGSAQTTAVGALAAGAGVSAILVAVLLLNARYVLFGATLRPWLGGCTPWQAYGSLHLLGDGNWLLSLRAYEAGERDAGYVFGSGAAMFGVWVLGSGLGAFMGGFVPDPRRLALDFFLVAFCAAMLAGMLRSATDRLPIVAALVAALAADRWLPAGWPIVAAGVAGIGTAWWRAGGAAAPEGAK